MNSIKRWISSQGCPQWHCGCIPTLISQKSRHVITTSSVAGLKAYPGGAVYGRTMWFVRDFIEVLCIESAQEGTHIRAEIIYPDAINTEWLNQMTDQDATEK